MVCACHAMNTSLGTAVYCMQGECCPTFITWTNSKHMSDIATVGHQLWHLFIINLAHYRLCKQFRLSTPLLYQLFQRLKMFTSDLPWWRRLFNQLAPFVLGLETPSDSKTRLCGLVLLCSVMGGRRRRGGGVLYKTAKQVCHYCSRKGWCQLCVCQSLTLLQLKGASLRQLSTSLRTHSMKQHRKASLPLFAKKCALWLIGHVKHSVNFTDIQQVNKEWNWKMFS